MLAHLLFSISFIGYSGVLVWTVQTAGHPFYWWQLPIIMVGAEIGCFGWHANHHHRDRWAGRNWPGIIMVGILVVAAGACVSLFA